MMDEDNHVFVFDGDIDPAPIFDRDSWQADKARNLIAAKISGGRLLAAKYFKCVECGAKATDYHHHNGYDEWHMTDVIPVCKKCHAKLEKELRKKAPYRWEGNK